jgi:hypothetical protein
VGIARKVPESSYLHLQGDGRLEVYFKKIGIISKLVEGQRAGIGKRLSDSRGPEGKSSCWQS